jgi:2'-5' RNA ligase
MRLFVAVDLDEPRRRAAARLAGELARRFAARGLGRAARWVEADNLHLTIRFIGEVAEDRARLIEDAVRPALATPAFDLGLGGLGVFPPSGAARVLWVGVTEGLASLVAIHDEIEARLERLGEAPEDRPFSAHLTLARFKDLDRAGSDALRAAIRDVAAAVGTCRVDRVTLYQSRLAPTGPVYTPLVHAQLA